MEKFSGKLNKMMWAACFHLCSPETVLLTYLFNIYTSSFFALILNLQVKGLVKQHIDSFNYFINVDVSSILSLPNISIPT